ncbi:MAG: sulfatase [Gemmatimonadetes bacterium]|nr:sulfatase [Gemmatimonadota bacterium]
MQPANLLYIISDQHNRDALGCYGHPVVQTPNLDRLSERGTRFANAYTNCAICVPVRASLATGRYVHQIRAWDNAHPYDGSVESWHHRLREQGHTIDSIGKLHFSGPDNDHGFSNEVEPLHVVEGVGDLLGCIREEAPFRKKRGGILNAGPGDSTYLQYDKRNADSGIAWLDAHKDADKPWACFLSFVCPHPPYIAPQEMFDLYAGGDLPWPKQWKESDWPAHGAMDYFRRFFDFGPPQFTEAEIQNMMAAYFGACTYVDAQIGRVLDHLEDLGLAESTRVVYTSDHGEHFGSRGIYGKFTMYDDACAVPMIAAGPGIPAGKVTSTPVSLIDTFQTAVECVGATYSEADADLSGESMFAIASEPDRDRTIFSEYHAVGSEHAFYMVRDRDYKYVHYVNDQPQLFDCSADPDEVNDLSQDASHAATVERYEVKLREIVEPEREDANAKTDQKAKLDSFGGIDAALARGAFDNSPVPGEEPAFRKAK